MTVLWLSIIGMWFCIGMAFFAIKVILYYKIDHAFMPRKFIVR